MKLNFRAVITNLLIFASIIWVIQYLYSHQEVYTASSAVEGGIAVKTGSLLRTFSNTPVTTTSSSHPGLFNFTFNDKDTHVEEVNGSPHATLDEPVSEATVQSRRPLRTVDDTTVFPNMSSWQPELVPSRANFFVFLEPDRSKYPYSAFNVSTPPLRRDKADEEHPIRIAYIFAGSARSFKCPKVHWSLRFNVIDALGGEPYVFIRVSEEDNENTMTGKGVIYTPTYDPAEVEEALKILNPVKITHFSLSNQLEEMRKYHPGMRHRAFQENDQRRYSMYFHRSMGYRMARVYEEEHDMRFDWVALIRLDAAWLDPVPPIQYFANDRVWITETGYAAFNDQFMLVPRSYSDYMFNLDTKVQRGVYCLGGPDVEKWKCKKEELVKRSYSPEMVEATLEACCPDALTRDAQGYSEIIHMRHMQFAGVPVAIARFTVFITRYQKNGDCYADCPRLHYNFKDYLMEALQREYPYWAPMNELDTRHLAIPAPDVSKCALINHGDYPWKPLKALEVSRLIAKGAAPSIDYSQNLYAQWDRLHPSIKLNPNEFQTWRIHPTRNTRGCLTFHFSNNTLSWETCETHLRIKGGRRFSPDQCFHLFVQPPDPALLRNPIVRAKDQVFAFETLPMPNVTMVTMFERTSDFFDIKYKVFCMTIVKRDKVPAWMNPLAIEMKKCDSTFNNPDQLFYTVQGGGLGSHPASTIGLLRSVKYPEYCLARDDWNDKGMEPYVIGSQLSFELCKPVVDAPGRQYFEFELVNF